MQIDFFQNLKQKTVIVGGDHHARSIVDAILMHLEKREMSVELVQYNESCKDYIEQSKLVAEIVSALPDKYCGIVGCKNGFGVTTVCNMYQNVFATRCDDPEQAAMSRQVNYSNILTFGASFVDEEEIKEIVDNWLDTDFELNEKNEDRLTRLFKIQQSTV